eukprot:727154-Rhodomonas_salina.1
MAVWSMYSNCYFPWQWLCAARIETAVCSVGVAETRQWVPTSEATPGSNSGSNVQVSCDSGCEKLVALLRLSTDGRGTQTSSADRLARLPDMEVWMVMEFWNALPRLAAV